MTLDSVVDEWVNTLEGFSGDIDEKDFLRLKSMLRAEVEKVVKKQHSYGGQWVPKYALMHSLLGGADKDVPKMSPNAAIGCEADTGMGKPSETPSEKKEVDEK